MAKCKRNRNRAKRNFTFKTPAANRNYKDTVFRMLFSDRKNLLSLYNAVNQSDYNNPDDLEIVTLENATVTSRTSSFLPCWASELIHSKVLYKKCGLICA